MAKKTTELMDALDAALQAVEDSADALNALVTQHASAVKAKRAEVDAFEAAGKQDIDAAKASHAALSGTLASLQQQLAERVGSAQSRVSVKG